MRRRLFRVPKSPTFRFAALVRYEKLEHTSLALNHLAATIIALRKVQLPINIVYG